MWCFNAFPYSISKCNGVFTSFLLKNLVRYPIHCYSTCDGAASRTGVLHGLEDTVGGFVLGDWVLGGLAVGGLVVGGMVLGALVLSGCIGTLAVRLRKGTLAAEDRPGGTDRWDGCSEINSKI